MFGNYSIMCVIFTISLTLEEYEQLPHLDLDSLLSRFYGSVRNKKPMNGVHKTSTDCSFIRGMVENYCPLGKI